MPSAKIGIMGCGVVADYGHAPVIGSTPGLTLHAAFDPDGQRGRRFADKHHVPHATSDAQAFFASGIDAVAITSPAPVHLANVVQACRHGKHVLCEKPLAMTVEECQAMLDAADESGIQLYTAFDYRFSPVAQTIHRAIRDGAIGRPRSLRLVYIWNLHGKWMQDEQGRRVEQPRRVGRMLEGGPMVDCGVHQIDLARWWLNSDVTRVQAAGAWVDDYEAPDHLYLHMDHACGAHSMVEISYSYCHTAADPASSFTYEVIGTDGVIRYDRNAKLFEIRHAGGTQTLPFAGEKNFAGMYAAFADALAQGSSPTLPSGFDGMEAVRISREATQIAIRQRQA